MRIKQLSKKRRRAFWLTHERVCVECGATEDLTIDHILARALGGTNAMDNLRCLCSPCNKAKSVGEAAEQDRRRKELFAKTWANPVLPVSRAIQTHEERRGEFRRLMQEGD